MLPVYPVPHDEILVRVVRSSTEASPEDELRVRELRRLAESASGIRERNDAGIQDPFVDGLVVEDRPTLALLCLRHLVPALDDDLFEASAQHEDFYSYRFLLADPAGSADGLGLDLRVEHGVDEVNPRG